MIPYHPIYSFSVGGLTIYTWGALAGLGFLVGSGLLVRLMGKMPRGSVEWYAIGVFVFGMIGARLAYMIANPASATATNPISVHDGFGFVGGVIGGMLASLGLIRLWRWPFWKTLDLTAIALVPAYIIGRIGCFLIHDHIGKPTNVPWGIRVDGATFHETSLYSILNGILLLVMLLMVRRYKPKDGTLFALFLIQYSVGRFIVEFFQVGPYLGPFTYTQWALKFLAIVGLVAIYVIYRPRNPLTRRT